MRISDWSSDVCSSDLADRDAVQRHRVARLHVDPLARNHHVARLQSLRRQDVGQLAVLVADQRDEGAAIGVVFEPLHRHSPVELATLEVADAVAALMPPAASAPGEPALVVAATLDPKPPGQVLARLALVTGRSEV